MAGPGHRKAVSAVVGSGAGRGRAGCVPLALMAPRALSELRTRTTPIGSNITGKGETLRIRTWTRAPRPGFGKIVAWWRVGWGSKAGE